MRFRLLDPVFVRFPTLCVGLVVATGVDNRSPAPEITALLHDAEQRTQLRFAAGGPADDPAIQLWRRAFTELGLSPVRFKSSVEALVTRVAKGSSLPALNPAVDLVNALSLQHLLPIGAHDLDRVRGDIYVGPAPAGMLFTPIGQQQQEPVEEGEFVYGDAQEVRTRRWVWRQSEHSKVTGITSTILFPIDGWLGATDGAVRAAQADLARYLEQELGAHTQSFFLDRDHPDVEILLPPALPAGVARQDVGFRMEGFGHVERPVLAERPAETPTAVAYAPIREGRATRWGGLDVVGGLLSRAIVDVVVREELEARLRRGDTLRVKFGVDPTSPQLHLGHAVVLRKLRAFQQLGHTICLVIGDFTAQIGDASDKTAMRQILTEEQVYANLATYRKQIALILDDKLVEWTYNADWLGPLRFKDIVQLASQFTVAQMLERENFTNRFGAGQPIGLHEFLYPLMQGYDSVALKADLELGGTEQLFNLLAGRTLQRAFGQPPQAVITVALLLGTDGRKMSKSFGNSIALDDTPKDMYGKVMSFPDAQIVPTFELCTDISLEELDAIADAIAAGDNPMTYKKRLAYEITRLYHGISQAQRANDAFEREVQRKERPDEIPEVVLERAGVWPLTDLVHALGLAPSKSEVRRKAPEGAVRVDGEQIRDPNHGISVRDGMVVQWGKLHYRRVRLPR